MHMWFQCLYMQISVFILRLHHRLFFQRWHCLLFHLPKRGNGHVFQFRNQNQRLCFVTITTKQCLLPRHALPKKPRGHFSGEVLWLSVKARHTPNGSDSHSSDRPWSNTTDLSRFGISVGASRTRIRPCVSIGSPKCPFLSYMPYVLRLVVCLTPDNKVSVSELVLETCFNLVSDIFF